MDKRGSIGMILLSCGIALAGALPLSSQVTKLKEQQHLAEKKKEQYIQAAAADETEIIKSSQIAYPKHKEAYAHIYNKDAGLDKEVYFGDSDDILDIGVGQYEGSAIPGQGRVILLAGHNGTHFKTLWNLKKGDIVHMDTSYGSYAYEVYDMEIMDAGDFDASFLEKEEEILTMYTCNWDTLTDEDRYFVYARKVSGPSIREDGTWKN